MNYSMQVPLDRARLISLAICSLLVVSGDSKAEDVKFNQQIRPLFAEYCFQCHGPDANKRKGDLRLDLEHSAKEHAIIGASESELFRRIESEDDDERMPKERITKGTGLSSQSPKRKYHRTRFRERRKSLKTTSVHPKSIGSS